MGIREVDHLVIGAGFASWYLDKHGHNTTLWPRSTFTFRALTRSFDVAAYTVTAPSPSSPNRKVVSV
jgi:hypothetical protein